MVPQKASGGGGVGGSGVVVGGRVVYHTSTGQYIGVATFFFYVSGLKLDEKSIENGLEGQKFLVVCLFWGGCHHPNTQIVPTPAIIVHAVGYEYHGTLQKSKLSY